MKERYKVKGTRCKAKAKAFSEQLSAKGKTAG